VAAELDEIVVPAQRRQRVEMQRTLRNPIGCVGIGLHTGAKVSLKLCPAEPDSGISFVRIDQTDRTPIQARFDQVCDTTMSTTVGTPGGAMVGTIEHLMAALAACRIDNLLVEVGGPEIPIMDGSAQPFVFLIECAGTREQDQPRRRIEILKTVTVTAHGKEARLEPLAETGDERAFEIDCGIEFDHPLIKSQFRRFALTGDAFKAEIARARTFGFAERVEELWSRGLALGGSLNNAVVVSRDKVLNKEGLRFPDEFVRHKVLDAVGDLYLAGAPINGRFVGRCAGHALHNKLVRALFADPTAWRFSEGWSPSDELAEEAYPLRRAAGA
jgi:UDP-3-O-[3-hydroxymyristoyl] N-acetylglucosamine deacetylase